MDLSNFRVEHFVRSWLTPQRWRVYSWAALIFYVLFIVLWSRYSQGFTLQSANQPGSDFSVFWAASHAALHGVDAGKLYEYPAFRAIRLALYGPGHGYDVYLPWLYPPTFLLLVTPLALLPFVVSFVAFNTAGVLVFTAAVRRASGLAHALGSSRWAALLIAACPCVFINILCGQNALLTAALAALSVYWVERHPWRAGVCIGLLAIKPQLALLFPFVLIATKAWRTLAAAAITATVFAGISIWVYGVRVLGAFMSAAHGAREKILDHTDGYWSMSPAPFSVLRAAGVPSVEAYVAAALFALLAVAATCHVWRRSRDVPLRAAVLAVSTLLASPYLWYYELTWLGVAMVCLAAIGLRRGWLPGEQPVLVLAWLLPIILITAHVTHWPQPSALGLVLVLWIIVRRVRFGDPACPDPASPGYAAVPAQPGSPPDPAHH